MRRSAGHLALPYQDMVSGAAHDALKVAAVTPAAMIFVPSQGGLSHNEAEWTSPSDCAAGASTLLHAILDRASAVS